MPLAALRRRRSVGLTLLFAVGCLLLISFACICLTDHGKQPVEPLGKLSFALALIEVWSPAATALLAAALLARLASRTLEPPTAAGLQRFLD